MLQELLDRTSTLGFEEFGWMYLDAVSWEENNTILKLRVREHNCPDELWLIRCTAVRESRLQNDRSFSAIKIEKKHPLLLPYTAPVVDLFFHGDCPDPDKTVGQLIEAHRNVVGDWFEHFRFFNLGPTRSLAGMLKGGNGKIASGPQPLLERYSEVLRRNSLEISCPAERPPRWYDGTKFVDDPGSLMALVLGTSFIIAAAVTVERG